MAEITKQFSTLIEMLEFRASQNPDKTAFTFQDQAYAFGEMWGNINQFGAYLQQLGVSPGDRVVLAIPNSSEFFTAFYGIQRVGGIAVPLFPGSGPERIFSIGKLCAANVIVAPDFIPPRQLDGFKNIGSGLGLRVVTVSESESTRLETEFPEIHPEDIAFIQYTSGSTGNPKGVQLSQDNLLTNIVQMILGMQITKDEIFVSWLPVYHDMGLILKTMVPFYLGAIVHLLPTDLRDVHPWLEAIHTHQATFTAAPDFAYRLCMRHADPEEYDLTSLRVALNAAEPVRSQTIQEFEHAYGLRGVMVAGYGLAEATVGVSMWTPGSNPKVDARGFVSVGRPFPGVEVTIVENGKKLAPGEIGEIAFRSAANSRGYFNNPEETKKLTLLDSYLLSGDLGYLDEEGYLYIVSRKKNIIKRSGETISPREVEEIVDQNSAVRYSAAVGIDRGRLAGEQVFVFAEIRDGETASEEELFDISLEIVNAIHSHMGFRPGRAYLLKPKSIPLTHNGKIQHVQLKESYLVRELHNSGVILYPDF
jgi:acyl-CoA synthetase (AMP-forming)/AMP-acid ligase II